jgi:hypothetical protein
MEVSGQLHASTSLPPGKSPDIHLIRGWLDPRIGLVAVAKRKKPLSLPGIEPPSSSPYLSPYTDLATPALLYKGDRSPFYTNITEIRTVVCKTLKALLHLLCYQQGRVCDKRTNK